MSGNPLDPTLGEEIAAALTTDEFVEFEAHLPALVEQGAPRVDRLGRAFLRGREVARGL